jgi:type IV secretory pathway VirB3-like protein
MLSSAKTYNAIHRKNTLFGMPLMPAVFVLMLGILVFCLLQLLSGIPLLGFLESLMKYDAMLIPVLLAGVYILHKLDPHAFDLLLFYITQDGHNGEAGCHHYQDR